MANLLEMITREDSRGPYHDENFKLPQPAEEGGLISRLIVVAPVGQLAVGDCFERWADVLHMTLTSPFDLPESRWDDFSGELVRRMEDNILGRQVGLCRQKFGPDKAGNHHDVTTFFALECSLSLAHIAAVVAANSHYSAGLDEKYIGLNWRPHISDGSSGHIKIDQPVVLDQVAVIQSHESDQKVVRMTISGMKSWKNHIVSIE